MIQKKLLSLKVMMAGEESIYTHDAAQSLLFMKRVIFLRIY
jgi:hypothetical protein